MELHSRWRFHLLMKMSVGSQLATHTHKEREGEPSSVCLVESTLLQHQRLSVRHHAPEPLTQRAKSRSIRATERGGKEKHHRPQQRVQSEGFLMKGTWHLIRIHLSQQIRYFKNNKSGTAVSSFLFYLFYSVLAFFCLYLCWKEKETKLLIRLRLKIKMNKQHTI